jgi:four helix bundle protein
MQDYRKLIAWQKAHTFTKEVYMLTSEFPSSELYGLTAQLRRAALSIPTNLAEGSARGSNADFARFVQISVGSASEAEYLLLISHELGYISQGKFEEFSTQIEEIKMILSGLLNKLKATRS